MAYIDIIDYETADESLRIIYDELTGKRGKRAEDHKVEEFYYD